MVHAVAAIGWWERVRSAVERVTKIYIKGELLNNFCHFVHLSWGLDLKKKKKEEEKSIGINFEKWLNNAQVLGNKGGITIINTTQAVMKSSPRLEMSGIHLTFLTEDDKVILATGKQNNLRNWGK